MPERRVVADRKLGQFAGLTATALKYTAAEKKEKKKQTPATHGQKYRVSTYHLYLQQSASRSFPLLIPRAIFGTHMFARLRGIYSSTRDGISIYV